MKWLVKGAIHRLLFLIFNILTSILKKSTIVSKWHSLRNLQTPAGQTDIYYQGYSKIYMKQIYPQYLGKQKTQIEAITDQASGIKALTIAKVLARSSISDKLLIQSICRKTEGKQMIMMKYRKNRSKQEKELRERKSKCLK